MAFVSTAKVLAAAVLAALLFVLAVEVPPSMAARPVPADGIDDATPEWPCCRQYDAPPSIAVEEALEHAAPPSVVIAPVETGADNLPSAKNETAEPEWPCCRQYDTPPSVADATPAGNTVEASAAVQDDEAPIEHSSPRPATPEPALYPGAGLATELLKGYPQLGYDGVISEKSKEEESGASEKTAEPEWPCCRQYDAPPAQADQGLNS